MRKLFMLSTLLLVIGTLLPVVAHADCRTVDDNSSDCLTRFGLIQAWRPVPFVAHKITDAGAAMAQSAYLEVEKDPPGKTETWSNPATHRSGKVTRITEDQNYPGKGATCFQYEHSIVLDGMTTKDRENLCWPMKAAGQ
jgi:hypothetical protein